MGVIMAVLSLTLFANTGGIVNLDIMDKFTNNVGIMSIALILIVILDWVLRRIDEFSTHLNMVSFIVWSAVMWLADQQSDGPPGAVHASLGKGMSKVVIKKMIVLFVVSM